MSIQSVANVAQLQVDLREAQQREQDLLERMRPLQVRARELAVRALRMAVAVDNQPEERGLQVAEALEREVDADPMQELRTIQNEIRRVRQVIASIRGQLNADEPSEVQEANEVDEASGADDEAGEADETDEASGAENEVGDAAPPQPPRS